MQRMFICSAAIVCLMASAPLQAEAQIRPGTVQIKGGPLSSLGPLLPRQQFVDETNWDIYLGTLSGNRRMNWRLLYGTGAPPAILGGIGDSYLNTATNDVYEKMASGWIFRANFTGPRGLQGVPGMSIVGPAGASGKDGKDGSPATISVGNVSIGAVGSMPLVSQRGTMSNAILDFVFPAPAQGERGPQGVPGMSIVGATGPAGKDGVSIVGPAGPAGASIVGPAGKDGKDGLSIVGPAGKDGTNALPLFRTARAPLPAIAIGLTTNINLTWTHQGAVNPFADTSYTVAGPGVVGSTVNVSYRITSLSATGATVAVTAISLVPAGSASIHLIAIHD